MPQRKGKDGKFQQGHGTYLDSKGYPTICVGPLRGKRVHVLVAEAMLGRKLEKHETIHHRDLNKQNPDWQNLKVLGRVDHGHVSSRQAWFMKHKMAKIEAAERAQWQQWIEDGGTRPDGPTVEDIAEGLAAADTSFNTSEL